MSLSLAKFKMSNIVFDNVNTKGPVVVFIGRRDTGKSVLVRDLLYYHQNIPIGTIISGTESGNGFYSSIVPKLFIHEKYDSSIIDKVMTRQRSLIRQIKKDKEMSRVNVEDPRTFVILDDCLYDDRWTRDVLMRELFMNGRHWKVMLIICMQYPMGLPPNLRTNIDYVFILRENVMSNRKRIYINYASMFPTFESFCSILDSCTENYECLVIDNNSKSNRLQDQIFWYKAEKRNDFKLCDKKYWDLSNEMTSDDDEEYDPNKNRNKNFVRINVKKLK